MKKQLILPGGFLWLAGLIVTVVGLNINSDAGRLTAIIGNILFLIGLGIVGAAWFLAQRDLKRKKADAGPEQDPEKPED